MVNIMVKSALTQLVLLLVLGQFVTSEAVTAISLTPSTGWFGNDGSWSAVSIRLGTPQQWVNLFPNTLSAETWAIGPSGCQDSDSTCSTSRGSLFNASQSSTWSPLLDLNGLPDWQLGTGNSLYWPPMGEYGLDSLSFGQDGPTIPNATIAMINATEYWVGSFGLGASVGNYSYVTPNSTYAQLEMLGDIVGAGYGYTAGAVYQQKGEPMSLTLGGYDQNRFIPHDITFALTQSLPAPQVFVDSISVLSSNGSTSSIPLATSEDNINAFIDSSTPYLWLPEAVCDRFADALGLTYNESLNLYTFDGDYTQHNNLSDSSSTTTFTFRFKDESTDADIVEINLPYAAFDLQLTYPYIPNTTDGTDEASKFYFPLARATNTSQYTIGRAFLQEAYIITSYETMQFSLHQAVHPFDTLNNKSIVAIKSASAASGSTNQEEHLSSGKIAGISLSVVGTLAILLATLWYYYTKSYKPRKAALALMNSISESEPGMHLQQIVSPKPVVVGASEAPGDDSHPVEINTDIAQPTEISSEVPHQRLELGVAIPGEPSAEIPIELPAELPTELPTDSFREGYTLDNSTAGPTVSSVSASQSASLPSMAALAISSAEPSFERAPSPLAPPTYALEQPNNRLSSGAILAANEEPSKSVPSPRPRTAEPSNFVFAGTMPSGIQPPNPFDSATRNRDAQVNEWRRRDMERQERAVELHRHALSREEEIRENQFQARRNAYRQELERMEHQGIDSFKYRNEDVGDIQNPFRASSNCQSEEPKASEAGPEATTRRFSFEKGDDDP